MKDAEYERANDLVGRGKQSSSMKEGNSASTELPLPAGTYVGRLSGIIDGDLYPQTNYIFEAEDSKFTKGRVALKYNAMQPKFLYDAFRRRRMCRIVVDESGSVTTVSFNTDQSDIAIASFDSTDDPLPDGIYAGKIIGGISRPTRDTPEYLFDLSREKKQVFIHTSGKDDRATALLYSAFTQRIAPKVVVKIEGNEVTALSFDLPPCGMPAQATLDDLPKAPAGTYGAYLNLYALIYRNGSDFVDFVMNDAEAHPCRARLSIHGNKNRWDGLLESLYDRWFPAFRIDENGEIPAISYETRLPTAVGPTLICPQMLEGCIKGQFGPLIENHGEDETIIVMTDGTDTGGVRVPSKDLRHEHFIRRALKSASDVAFQLREGSRISEIGILLPTRIATLFSQHTDVRLPAGTYTGHFSSANSLENDETRFFFASAGFKNPAVGWVTTNSGNPIREAIILDEALHTSAFEIEVSINNYITRISYNSSSETVFDDVGGTEK